MGNMFDGDLLEEKITESRDKLINEILISKYLNDMGIYADSGSGKIKCPNPFHQDGTPSFVYDDDNGECNCFGCELGGSIVELNYRMLLEDYPDYSILKSINDLAKEYNIKLPSMQRRNIYGLTKNRVRPSKRERFSDIKDVNFYIRKVKELSLLGSKVEGKVEDRIEYYRWIDDMWKGYKTPKQVYYKLKYNKDIDYCKSDLEE